MARVTCIAAGNMVRAFSAGKNAIVTGDAVIHKLGVINRGWNPLLRTMTITAFLGSGDMN